MSFVFGPNYIRLFRSNRFFGDLSSSYPSKIKRYFIFYSRDFLFNCSIILLPQFNLENFSKIQFLGFFISDNLMKIGI